MVITTHSDKETKKFARDFAGEFKSKGGVIALYGDLGAGKTTFVQGFAEGMGVKEKVISPTFILIRQHRILSLLRTLYHIDLYRLEEPISIQGTGISELFRDSDDLVLIEWAEKIEKDLPKDSIRVFIKKISEEVREIKIQTVS